MFFTKMEPSIPFPRLSAKETLLSHIKNSTDYFINTQLTSFVSSCFELRDKLPGGGGGGVLLEIFGRGVPPGSQNPDPISDLNILFSTPVFRPGP